MLISLDKLPATFLKLLPKPDLLVAVTADVSVREERMTSRGWTPREELGYERRLTWQRNAETAFYEVLPSIEKLVKVYRYDGTQDPVAGAAMLMVMASKESHVTIRGSSARKLFKTVLAILAFLIVQFARIFQRTPEVVVLMYHSIDRSGWKLSVTPEAFERQMEYLSKKGWVVPLADVVAYAKGKKKLPTHAVAVTFDDGYRDILATALPILERYHVPATVFIPSDLSVQTDQGGKARLTEEELRVLAISPLITIGSHAKTHRKFTELSPEEMKDEAKESADKLAQMTEKRPNLFAYPFGARSKNAERTVKDVGYEAAFGISEGTIRQGDDPFRLKRVQVDGTMNFMLFRIRLTSAIDWNRRIVDIFRRA